MTDVIQFISIAIALLALAVNAWFSWQRYKHDRAARSVAASVSLLKEWRDLTMRDAEVFVLSKLNTSYEPKLGFAKIPLEDQRKALAISHLCDEIAMRVIFGDADAAVIFTSLGDQMISLWTVLEPYIHAERRIRSFPAYQGYFEAFVQRAKATNIAGIRERKTNDFLRRSA